MKMKLELLLQMEEPVMKKEIPSQKFSVIKNIKTDLEMKMK